MAMKNKIKLSISKLTQVFRNVEWEKGYRFIIAHLNINTASLVIAILAAYISYKSLDESVKQRESMYKPEVFIGSVDFYANVNNQKDIKFYRFESDSVFVEERIKPWYRLNNVGMGSALSVYGHMFFNTETFQRFFTMNQLKGVEIIPIDDFENALVYNQDTINVFKDGYVSDWTVDYVLPISQSEEESIQYFPPNVLDEIVRAYLWVLSEKDDKSISSFNIPVELDYKDINGKWYKKEFEMTIDCISTNSLVRCIIKAGLSLEDSIREWGESIEN